MKKPLCIIFNDVHLKTGNEEAVLEAFNYMVTYANIEGIKRFIFAGDLFDSRSFQRLKVLNTFDEMLETLSSNGMTVDIIPGNHDKSVYKSYDSFLDVFTHYPAMKLWRGISDIEIDGVKITLLPFFSDDMLIPMLEEHKGSDVLISHFEMAGSAHLGNVSKKTTINEKLLSKWDKTYLGHYHNHHEITDDIVHLPSFIQDSFGEDSNKGFTVLYDDLSYDLVKGRFKELQKVVIDLNKEDIGKVKELIKQYSDSENTVRFEFVGEDAKLKALDKSMFKDTGINVKLKYEVKFTDEAGEVPQIVEHYGSAQVRGCFKDFCEDKGHNYKEGLELLNEFLSR